MDWWTGWLTTGKERGTKERPSETWQWVSVWTVEVGDLVCSDEAWAVPSGKKGESMVASWGTKDADFVECLQAGQTANDSCVEPEVVSLEWKEVPELEVSIVWSVDEATDAISLLWWLDTGYCYLNMTVSDEAECTPAGTGHEAAEGLETEHDHHNPEVPNTLVNYLVRDEQDMPHTMDDTSPCMQILFAQACATEWQWLFTCTTVLGWAPCLDVADVMYLLLPYQTEGSATDWGTMPVDSKGMSVEPVWESPGVEMQAKPCLYYPLPMEFLVETDAIRPKRGGSGRWPRKGEGRTETSGRGTAYLYASETSGTDLEEHMGPVPGAGSEWTVSPKHETDDTWSPHENDDCPPCQPQGDRQTAILSKRTKLHALGSEVLVQEHVDVTMSLGMKAESHWRSDVDSDQTATGWASLADLYLDVDCSAARQADTGIEMSQTAIGVLNACVQVKAVAAAFGGKAVGMYLGGTVEGGATTKIGKSCGAESRGTTRLTEETGVDTNHHLDVDLDGTHSSLDDVLAGEDVTVHSGPDDAAAEHETMLNWADRPLASGTVWEVVVMPDWLPAFLAALEIGNGEDANDHAKAMAEDLDSRVCHAVCAAINT